MCQICKMFCQTRSWEGIHVLCFALVKSPPTHPCPPWAPGAPIGNSSFLYQTSHLSQRDGIDRHAVKRSPFRLNPFFRVEESSIKMPPSTFLLTFSFLLPLRLSPTPLFHGGLFSFLYLRKLNAEVNEIMKIPDNGIFLENTSKTFFLSKVKQNKGGFLLHIVLGTLRSNTLD